VGETERLIDCLGENRIWGFPRVATVGDVEPVEGQDGRYSLEVDFAEIFDVDTLDEAELRLDRLLRGAWTDLAGRFEPDPDSDRFYFYSTDRKALDELARRARKITPKW
jgi:hypothetical protein